MCAGKGSDNNNHGTLCCGTVKVAHIASCIEVYSHTHCICITPSFARCLGGKRCLKHAIWYVSRHRTHWNQSSICPLKSLIWVNLKYLLTIAFGMWRYVIISNQCMNNKYRQSMVNVWSRLTIWWQNTMSPQSIYVCCIRVIFLTFGKMAHLVFKSQSPSLTCVGMAELLIWIKKTYCNLTSRQLPRIYLYFENEHIERVVL